MEENRSARHYTDNYYQAVAERTPVVAALGPLLLRSTARRALHRLHPSNMSQIAPFDLAGRALHTGDTTSRVTDRHGAHPLRPDHPVHDIHHLRPIPECRCAICGTPLPSTDSGRPRTYCSDACKQKAYRIRQSLRNPLMPCANAVSLEVSAIRDHDTASPAISDPAAANESTWQACFGDTRA